MKFDKSAIATINGPKHSTLYLLAAIQRARRTKAEIEIEFMKKAQSITEGAHIALMKGVGRGIIKDENDAESIFVAHCRKLGSK